MFKSVLALVVFMSAMASAQNLPGPFKLPKDSEGLRLINSYVSKQVVVMGGGHPGSEAASTLEVAVNLNGCLDQLGPVAYTSETSEDGKTTFYISAYNVNMKGSRKAMCNRIPTAKIKIFLGIGFADADSYEVKMLTDSAN